VWFAHSVHVNQEEIAPVRPDRLRRGALPVSNMRLASGIAPVLEMLRHGMKVGLGVDGSASNDGSHLLAEVRQAMLVSRLRAGLRALRSRAKPAPADDRPPGAGACTRGGAAVLGRSDIGSLEVGKCADFFAVDLNRLELRRRPARPGGGVVFCAPVRRITPWWAASLSSSKASWSRSMCPAGGSCTTGPPARLIGRTRFSVNRGPVATLAEKCARAFPNKCNLSRKFTIDSNR
jgi:cytosine/adenosine deaminase-related metal-dependent hydrolase